MTWEEEREQIEIDAINAIRAGVRMSDIAAKAGFGASTIRIWAKRVGVQHRPQLKPTYIYCLKSPIDGLIYYVGKANNPQARLYQHTQKPTNKFMADWFASLRSARCRPKLIVLAHLKRNPSQWQAIELAFITKYRRLGHPLLNFEAVGWCAKPMRRQKRL